MKHILLSTTKTKKHINTKDEKNDSENQFFLTEKSETSIFPESRQKTHKFSCKILATNMGTKI